MEGVAYVIFGLDFAVSLYRKIRLASGLETGVGGRYGHEYRR